MGGAVLMMKAVGGRQGLNPGYLLVSCKLANAQRYDYMLYGHQMFQRTGEWICACKHEKHEPAGMTNPGDRHRNNPLTKLPLRRLACGPSVFPTCGS